MYSIQSSFFCLTENFWPHLANLASSIMVGPAGDTTFTTFIMFSISDEKKNTECKIKILIRKVIVRRTLSNRFFFSTFQHLAVGILEEGYEQDVSKTRLIAIRKLDFWTDYTCADLAINSQQVNFVAHPIVHTLMDELWYEINFRLYPNYFHYFFQKRIHF